MENNTEGSNNMDVTIKMTGSGLDFNGTITLFQAAQIMAAIAKPGDVKTNDNQPELLTGDVVAQPQVLKPVQSAYESPRQAIELLGATTNPQKIVAIALYLGANSENSKLISNEEVLAEFVKAGEAKPAKIARDVKDAVAAGYLYPESKTTFRVLTAADSIPEVGFKKPTRKRTVIKGNKGEPAVKLVVRPEVTDLPITATLDGYKDFFDLDKRSDQILWILKYVQPTMSEGLNRLEIIQICSKLGGDINSQSFTSSNTPNIKNGYLAVTKEMMALTAKAEKHMTEKLTVGSEQ